MANFSEYANGEYKNLMGWTKHIKVPSVTLVRASTKDWYVDGLALLKRIKVLGPSGFGSKERPETIKYKTLGRAHATVQIHVLLRTIFCLPK